MRLTDIGTLLAMSDEQSDKAFPGCSLEIVKRR